MAAPTADEILDLYDELNFPSAAKLRAALLKRGYRARLSDVEAFAKAQTPRSSLPRAPTIAGASSLPGSTSAGRWTSSTSQPSQMAGLSTFCSHRIFAAGRSGPELWLKTRPTDYTEALKGIMRQAGKPKEINFGGEFDNPQCIRFLSAGGVEYRVKEGKQDLGVLDASMGALKKDLKKDMQVHGTDKWGSRLDKVVRGMNDQSRQALLGSDANTAHYKPGQEQPKDKALEFELREHAGRQVADQNAQVRLAQ